MVATIDARLLNAPEAHDDMRRMTFARADEDRAREPLEVGRGRFEGRHGAEVDQIGIDRLAGQELGGERPAVRGACRRSGCR